MVLAYLLGTLAAQRDNEDRLYANFVSIYHDPRASDLPDRDTRSVPYFNSGSSSHNDDVVDEREGAPVEWLVWDGPDGKRHNQIATPHWHREAR